MHMSKWFPVSVQERKRIFFLRSVNDRQWPEKIGSVNGFDVDRRSCWPAYPNLIRRQPFRTSGLPGGGILKEFYCLTRKDGGGDETGLKIPTFVGRPKWMAPEGIEGLFSHGSLFTFCRVTSNDYALCHISMVPCTLAINDAQWLYSEDLKMMSY